MLNTATFSKVAFYIGVFALILGVLSFSAPVFASRVKPIKFGQESLKADIGLHGTITISGKKMIDSSIDSSKIIELKPSDAAKNINGNFVFPITYSVKNYGEAAVKTAFKNQWSYTPRISSFETPNLTGAQSVANLNIGGIANISSEIVFPGSEVIKNQYEFLKVHLDSENQVVESNEKNNLSAFKLKFTGFTTSTIITSTLSVSLSEYNPNTAMRIAGTVTTLGAFQFIAANEDIELQKIYLTQLISDPSLASHKDYEEIWFEDVLGNEIAGTKTIPVNINPLMSFANNAFAVSKANVKGAELYLKAKLAPIEPGSNGVAGHYLGYTITSPADVVAKGLSSGNDVNSSFGSPVPTGNVFYVYKSYPIFQKSFVNSNMLTNGTKDLFKFKITAAAISDISLNKFTFIISPEIAKISSSSLYLYDVTNSMEKQVNNIGLTLGGNGEVEIFVDSLEFPDKEIIIGAGQTRTFVLRGHIVGAITGASIATQMLGDSAHITVDKLMTSAADVDNDSEDDFIWSDRNDISHSISTADWTNGFLVLGLPKTGTGWEVIAY